MSSHLFLYNQISRKFYPVELFFDLSSTQFTVLRRSDIPTSRAGSQFCYGDAVVGIRMVYFFLFSQAPSFAEFDDGQYQVVSHRYKRLLR